MLWPWSKPKRGIKTTQEFDAEVEKTGQLFCTEHSLIAYKVRNGWSVLQVKENGRREWVGREAPPFTCLICRLDRAREREQIENPNIAVDELSNHKESDIGPVAIKARRRAVLKARKLRRRETLRKKKFNRKNWDKEK